MTVDVAARSFTPLEAYEHVLDFAASRGEDALTLAMHAALPQVLRPEVLHLIRLNFVPDSIDNAALEADVLFAPFCECLGNDYFRFDANARLQLLGHLDPVYRQRPTMRSQQVASFLLSYFDRQSRDVASSSDAVYATYLEVERWVALAFLDGEVAAAQLAHAVKQATDDSEIAARVRLSGLTSALSTPLAQHHALLSYAAGVELLQRGEIEEAREELTAFGDDEVEMAGVRLPSAEKLFEGRLGRAAASAAPASPPAAESSVDVPREAEPVTEPNERPVDFSSESSGRRPMFYVAYSRQDSDPQLRYFFDTLSAMVARRAGRQFDGFFDDSSVAAGDGWSSITARAISATDVVVAMLTPAFVRDRQCASELGLFALRSGRGDASRQSRILPVYWSSVAAEELPEYFRQFVMFGVGARAGLSALTESPEEAQAFNTVVAEIAAAVVSASRDPLPRISVPSSLSEVPPLWSLPDRMKVDSVSSKADPSFDSPSVYLSYRESDVGGWGVAIADVLKEHGCQVLKDTARSVVAGLDEIRARVESAGAVVVLIGRRWSKVTDDHGRRRLDDPDDSVRFEIGIALNAGIPVLPVLVDGAAFPMRDELPPDIAALSTRNALEYSDSDDTPRLIEFVRRVARPPRRLRKETQHRRIYISSTLLDLAEHRAATIHALGEAGHDVIGHDSTASEAAPEDRAMAELATADLVVLIVGFRYGYVPEGPTQLSITELEYRAARDRGIPILAFMSDGEPGPDSYRDGHEGRSLEAARVKAFRDAVAESEVVQFFRNPNDLAASVIRAVNQFVVDGSRRGEPPKPSGGPKFPPKPEPRAPGQAVLFVGLSIDRPKSKRRRFPADLESAARNAIRSALEELGQASRIERGIASGCSGGDILFHEVCHELGIPTDLYLPTSLDRFLQTYVVPAGQSWRDRFERMSIGGAIRYEPPGVLGRPRWPANTKMMFEAAQQAANGRVTVLALWDGSTDSASGPSTAVHMARAAGLDVKILDTRSLFTNSPRPVST